MLALEAGGFGSESWASWTLIGDALERYDVGPGRSPVALADDGAEAVAIGPGMLIDTVAVRRWDGAAWSAADDDTAGPFGEANGFAAFADVALGADGTLAAVWTDGQSTPDGRILTGWFVGKAPDGAFGEREPVFTPDDGDVAREIHVAVDAAGGAHVMGHMLGEDGVGMVYRARSADGTWGDIVPVGPAPGTLGNITVSGIAVAADGGVYIAEAHEEGGFDDIAGATVVYRVDGGAPREVGRIDDDRFVVGALAIAPLGDGVVIGVSHGANNFDPAESDDSVDVYLCNGGGCAAVWQPATTRGVFYDSVTLATRGDEGAILWNQSPKVGIDAPEAARLQRFTCP